MQTLHEQVNSRFVRYDMALAAYVVIRGTKKMTVQKDDGTYGDITTPGCILQRASRGSTLSPRLDPVEHAEYIEEVDKFIEVNVNYARQLGLRKIGSTRPDERIENWDNMDLDEIEMVMKATNGDLLWAYEYETHHPEGQRADVLELLEEMNVTGDTVRAEASEEAPAI